MCSCSGVGAGWGEPGPEWVEEVEEEMIEIGRGGGLANWTVLTGRGIGTGRERGGAAWCVAKDRVGSVGGAKVSGLVSKEGVDAVRGGSGKGTRETGVTREGDDALVEAAAGEGRGRLGVTIDASEGIRGGVASLLAEGREGMGLFGSAGAWSAVESAAKVAGTGGGGGGAR